MELDGYIISVDPLSCFCVLCIASSDPLREADVSSTGNSFDLRTNGGLFAFDGYFQTFELVFLDLTGKMCIFRATRMHHCRISLGPLNRACLGRLILIRLDFDG